MTYQEAVKYLDTYTEKYRHTDIHRMQALMRELGDPQKGMHFVHVAGTNGKGSCSAMTESILRTAGYRTGLFTSPHLIDFRERMRVNGQMISEEELAEVLSEVDAANRRLEERVNWFEIVTAVALVWFYRQNCDVVVLEVGVGGEFDGTNVIDVPDCAVLMNIGLDHTEQLGDTLEKIALTKSGIIKEGGDVVIYRGRASVENIFEKRCREENATLVKADFDSIVPIAETLYGQKFDACGFRCLEIPLLGAHQRKNTAVVLAVIDVLRRKGYCITEENIREGLRNVEWPVRFQIMQEHPLFILDGGHNPQCIEAVRDSLKALLPEGIRLVILTGILKGKDAQGMVEILSDLTKDFVLTSPDSYRARSAEELLELADRCGCHAVVCPDSGEAVRTAIELAGPDGAVCCIGSLYLAGEVLDLFRRKSSLSETERI